MIPVQITQLSTNKNPIHLTLDVGWVEKYKTVTGNPIVISDGVKDTLLKKLQMTLEPKQSGSGTPSPSNIRPISGWTGAVVTRDGKNLLPPKFYRGVGYNSAVGTQFTLTDITNTVTESSGVFSKSVSAWGGITMVSDELPNGAYHLYTVLTSHGLRMTGYVLDKDLKVVRQFELLGSGTTMTLNENITLADTECYIAVMCASNVAGTVSFSYPQIEVGSAKTDYEPYQGHTYTTDLPQTVYGGTLDVVSGVLTVTHGYISQYNGETINEPWISDRDEYVAGTTPTTGAQVVYLLATPTTIQCDPQTVSLLAGENVIMGDGDMEITYRVKASA